MADNAGAGAGAGTGGNGAGAGAGTGDGAASGAGGGAAGGKDGAGTGAGAAAGDGAGGGGKDGSGAGGGNAGGADGKGAADGAGAKAGAGAGDGKGTGADGKGAGSGDGAGDGTAGKKWGEDWRESYAGQDEKKLNVLKRYASPQAALDALFAAQAKIGSGEVKAPLPANATPEQVAQYRKDNGIPEKPEGYLTDLPADVKIAPHNKDMATYIATRMHEVNAPPALVQQGLRLVNDWQEQLIEKRIDQDARLQVDTEEALRQEWGPEYRANVNNIKAWLGTAPAEVSEGILHARTMNGDPLVSSPSVMRWLGALAREALPFGTIVPGASGSVSAAAGEARIAEIEAMMKPNHAQHKEYLSNEKIQKEYRDLIDARARNNARGGTAAAA